MGRGRTVAPAVEAPVHEPWYSGIQWDPWVFPSLWCIICFSLSEESAADFPLPLPLSPRTQTPAALACRWWSDWSGAAGMLKRGVRTIEGTSKALFYTLRITLTCTTHTRTHTRTHTIAYLRICAFAHPRTFRGCQWSLLCASAKMTGRYNASRSLSFFLS